MGQLKTGSTVSNNIIYTATSNLYIGTTLISLGRSSGSQTLTGVSIDGNAATSTVASSASSVTWTNVSGKPTTVSGYGITDAITTGTYNSFCPTLTGSGASGTWSINITGSASSLNIGNSYQINSLGVGTSASGTTGEIRATNNITAYYSDDRLKKKLGNIENALDKICSLTGFYYEANEIAQELGYKPIREVGVSAQEVQKILPEIIAPAPIDEKYLTVRYERMIPLIIEAIKELREELRNI